MEAGCLAVRWFATRVLGLRPQRVANGLSGGGSSSLYRGNLDPPINDRALELRQGALRTRTFHRLGHETQYETSRTPAQAPSTGSRSQNGRAGGFAQVPNLPGKHADKGQPESSAFHARRPEPGALPRLAPGGCLATVYLVAGNLGRTRRRANLFMAAGSAGSCEAAASGALLRCDQPHPLQTRLDRS